MRSRDCLLLVNTQEADSVIQAVKWAGVAAAAAKARIGIRASIIRVENLIEQWLR